MNSNSYGIAAGVQEAGGIPVWLGIAKDDPDSLKEKILQGLGCDIVVLSGGVSMGDYDFTKPVFAEIGAEMNFWKLAIRPGQPVAFVKMTVLQSTPATTRAEVRPILDRTTKKNEK